MNIVKSSIFAGVLGVIVSVTSSPLVSFNTANAQAAGQADCAIWLCLPLGFTPPACAPAAAAFARRTANPFRPPLPPFPLCVVPGLPNASVGTFTEGREEFESCEAGFEPVVIREPRFSNSDLEILERDDAFNEGRLVCVRPETCTGLGTSNPFCGTAYTPARRTDQEFVEVFIDGVSQGRYFYTTPE